MNGQDKTSRFRSLALGAVAASLLALSGPALAASSGGGGSGSSGGSSGGGSTTPTCKSGMVWNKAKGICEKASSGLFDDGTLYEQGRALALAGDYDSALVLFAAIRDKADSDILTMIGYAKRKSGAVEEGIGYYHRALALDPTNVNTREYLGEGYVALGRLDLAQAELDQIASLCGETCDQYLDLAAAMAGNEDWNRTGE
jgi:tetratricopeptide (TPR) repeat protein